jgi:mono/diheme cytochrome c family protein
VLILALASLGCRQQMAVQPRVDPLESSAFFADGRSARAPVPGTVARGHLRDDVHLYFGQVAQPRGAGRASDERAALGATVSERTTQSEPPYAAVLPFPATKSVLQRGQERYLIYCVVCHGPLGDGDGKVVERGYTKPPSFRTDRSRGYERRGKVMALRDVPVGYLFDVITNGFGAMPDYASEVPTEDRWAIIAYIRALQAVELPTPQRSNLSGGETGK